MLPDLNAGLITCFEFGNACRGGTSFAAFLFINLSNLSLNGCFLLI